MAIDALPAGPFDVVVCDPPWHLGVGKTSNRLVPYPTMTVDELKSMELPVERNGLLFLWTTGPMLKAALEVMEVWRFKYRTHGVWVKPRRQLGTGMWFRSRHEVFLLGRRGNAPQCPRPAPWESVIEAPRRAHSQKPEELQDMIERALPGLRYLELFARRSRPNWSCWGNEL